ncbi:hypothetical protein TWF569_008657 [Orbilia oligospora]|nr:hypothetical protein TWF569_008657 [Orbilia oligospora]KAF3157318.1 hypothetical protein TWF751_002426 [Orbilia oligospora]
MSERSNSDNSGISERVGSLGFGSFGGNDHDSVTRLENDCHTSQVYNGQIASLNIAPLYMGIHQENRSELANSSPVLVSVEQPPGNLVLTANEISREYIQPSSSTASNGVIWKPVDYANFIIGPPIAPSESNLDGLVNDEPFSKGIIRVTKIQKSTKPTKGGPRIPGPKPPICCTDGIWVFRSHEADLYASKLLEHGFEKGELKFLVEWKDSWVPASTWTKSEVEGKYWKARGILSTNTSGPANTAPVPMHVDWEPTWESVSGISQELLFDYLEFLKMGRRM